MIVARNEYVNIAGALIEAGPDVNKIYAKETTLSFFARKNNVQGATFISLLLDATGQRVMP